MLSETFMMSERALDSLDKYLIELFSVLPVWSVHSKNEAERLLGPLKPFWGNDLWRCNDDRE